MWMSGLGQLLNEQDAWRRRASLVESVKLYAPGNSMSPRRTVDMRVFLSGPLKLYVLGTGLRPISSMKSRIW